jgi:hypothetical protein
VKVFVSHADADKQIALLFVELLKNGIGISDVFCSSSKGAIPNGQYFVQHILTELHAANVTLALLSSHYLKSQFCIAELGSAIVSQFQNKASFNSFLITPTRFGDLGGMLFGVQSEYLDETATLDGLFARLTSRIPSKEWVTARDTFQQAIKPIGDRRNAEALLEKIIIHDFRADATNDARVVFKSKIRVQLKNNTGTEIEVSNPSWKVDAADVPLQVPAHNFKVLQLETSQGWHSDAWAKEDFTIAVPPGAVFRLWFGLHQAFGVDELRRRHEGQLLGRLNLQVKINLIDLIWEKRL